MQSWLRHSSVSDYVLFASHPSPTEEPLDHLTICQNNGINDDNQ
jgi:hypothetical protein